MWRNRLECNCNRIHSNEDGKEAIQTSYVARDCKTLTPLSVQTAKLLSVLRIDQSGRAGMRKIGVELTCELTRRVRTALNRFVISSFGFSPYAHHFSRILLAFYTKPSRFGFTSLRQQLQQVRASAPPLPMNKRRVFIANQGDFLAADCC